MSHAAVVVVGKLLCEKKNTKTWITYTCVTFWSCWAGIPDLWHLYVKSVDTETLYKVTAVLISKNL